MNWYYSGLPYSDELYHYGTPRMQWGIRKYQNEDGSLTPLGRIHYGVGKARESLKNKFKGRDKENDIDYKRRHPNKMTIEELNAELNRQKALSALKAEKRKQKIEKRDEKLSEKLNRQKLMADIEEQKRKQKIAERDTKHAKEVVSGILESGAKILTTKAFNTLASKIFDKKDPAVKGLAEVLADKNSTIQEIRDAKEKFRETVEYNRQKAYNEYVQKFNDDFVKKGSTRPTEESLQATKEYADLLRDISGMNNNAKGGGKNNKGNKGNGGN